MDDNALIEVLTRIADSLEGVSSSLDSIEREVGLLPAPLEDIVSSTQGISSRLHGIEGATDVYWALHKDEV